MDSQCDWSHVESKSSMSLPEEGAPAPQLESTRRKSATTANTTAFSLCFFCVSLSLSFWQSVAQRWPCSSHTSSDLAPNASTDLPSCNRVLHLDFNERDQLMFHPFSEPSLPLKRRAFSGACNCCPDKDPPICRSQRVLQFVRMSFIFYYLNQIIKAGVFKWVACRWASYVNCRTDPCNFSFLSSR